MARLPISLSRSKKMVWDYFLLSTLNKRWCELENHSPTWNCCPGDQRWEPLPNYPSCDCNDRVFLVGTWPSNNRKLMAQCQNKAFLRFIRMIWNMGIVIGRLAVNTDGLHWLLSLSLAVFLSQHSDLVPPVTRTLFSFSRGWWFCAHMNWTTAIITSLAPYPFTLRSYSPGKGWTRWSVLASVDVIKKTLGYENDRPITGCIA
jgi:hypothetical protein